MKIALISAFLEDDIYGEKLTDEFMKNVICNEDSFHHRIAKSIETQNHQPVMFYMSTIKQKKSFTHKYGHEIIRVHAKQIPFIHESIIYSSELINSIKDGFDICQIVSGYYVMYKIPDMFDYITFKLYKKMPIISRWAGGNYKWLFPIRKYIKKKSLEKCDRIICSGKDEIEILKKRFGINEEKILHMFNPIDIVQFKPRERKEIIGKIKFEMDKKYLLHVGRLIEDHGIEIILDVFKKINQKNKNIILIIIGDGPLLKKIQQFIFENNLEDFVELKGRLDHKLISYYYNISSALFHVGPSGGMPNVIMEAIVSGLPVIASNSTAANKDLVNEKNGTGILVKLNDKIELEKAILKIINQKEKMDFTNADLIKKFSIENYGKEMDKIYHELISR
ncbi:MAG: hypothetical protein CXT78_02335 [Thaumarchaeota archaeon]|nr:MAG: hypothetical protein CXT78_02335 [Nitrososphaerota archaeon]